MTGGFCGEPETTEEEILYATYRSLATHGYADLTIKTIGEELGTSPSLVYHHFENKEELVLACLEFMLSRYQEHYVDRQGEAPAAGLDRLLEMASGRGLADAESEFLALLVDLRSQAAHNDRFREHFTRSDAVFREHIAELLGEAEMLETVALEDPDRSAEFLFTVLLGALVRVATSDESGWTDDVDRELEAYLHPSADG